MHDKNLTTTIIIVISNQPSSHFTIILPYHCRYGANPNNCRSEKGSTDLFFEMDGGATLLIRLTSSWAETAFPHSLPAMVTVLVEAGADINATDFMGCTYSVLLLLFLPFLSSTSLSHSLARSLALDRSTTACLYSLTPHGTSLTIISNSHYLLPYRYPSSSAGHHHPQPGHDTEGEFAPFGPGSGQ